MGVHRPFGREGGADLLAELFEQSAGLGQADGEIRFPVEERVDGREARVGDLLVCQERAAGDRDGGDGVSGCGGGHPYRGFAVEALLVEAALTGDDERHPSEKVVESDEVENQLDTGSDGGV